MYKLLSSALVVVVLITFILLNPGVVSEAKGNAILNYQASDISKTITGNAEREILVSRDNRYAVIYGSGANGVRVMTLTDLSSGRTSAVDKGKLIIPESFISSSSIAYSKDGDLYIYDIKAGKKRRISENAYNLQMSIDNGRMIFTRHNGVFTAKGDGKAILHIIKGMDDLGALLFPDGRKILVFINQKIMFSDKTPYSQKLGVYDIKTRKITSPVADKRSTGKFKEAQWVIPGRTVFVQKDASGKDVYEIFDLKSDSVVNISDSDKFGSSYAVDKKHNVIYRVNSTGLQKYDDTQKTFVSAVSIPQEKFLVCDSLALSSDGKYAAFREWKPLSSSDLTQRIVIIELETGKKCSIESQGVFGMPAWGGDSSKVYFTGKKTGALDQTKLLEYTIKSDDFK